MYYIKYQKEVFSTIFCDNSSIGSTQIMYKKERATSNLMFNKNWHNYKMGFGDLKGNFWLGLDKLNCLTQYFKMNLTIEMYINSTDEKYYVVYGGFGVGNESTNYKLSLGRKISGNLDDKSVLHNGQMFSTSHSTKLI